MKNGNELRKWVQVTQWGLSCVTPMILLLFLAIWLKNRFQLGSWILIVAILLGVATIFNNFYRLYREHTPKNSPKKEKPTQYNHHQ